MIKTVIFDLGGVIVPLDFPRAYAALESFSPYSAHEIQQRILGTGLVEKLEMGQVAPEKFAAVVSGEIGLDVSYEHFCELWGNLFPLHTLVPDSLLAAIGKQHRLLLLSNTNAIHFPYVRRHYPLLEHFDGFVLSYELGVMKPAPEIYLAAVEQAGCKPAECFFVDDVEENVAGARKAGLEALRFESVEQIEADFRAAGIAIS